MSTNNRETGARKLQNVQSPRETDQNAGMPKKPQPYGLTESLDDVDEKTRHSDGMSPRKGAADAKEADAGGSDARFGIPIMPATVGRR